MPDVVALGQISIVDLTDTPSITMSLTCNVPQTQIYDPNINTIVPDWNAEAMKITPVVSIGNSQ